MIIFGCQGALALLEYSMLPVQSLFPITVTFSLTIALLLKRKLRLLDFNGFTFTPFRQSRQHHRKLLLASLTPNITLRKCLGKGSPPSFMVDEVRRPGSRERGGRVWQRCALRCGVKSR
uniref:Uncharacterized protein n=1 Tax=Arundo donax TaxID=35708 RepID=A0A0A9D1J5_ARUDO